jgi:hypothetical protein
MMILHFNRRWLLCYREDATDLVVAQQFRVGTSNRQDAAGVFCPAEVSLGLGWAHYLDDVDECG